MERADATVEQGLSRRHSSTLAETSGPRATPKRRWRCTSRSSPSGNGCWGLIIPVPLGPRTNLANAYWAAGRAEEAVALDEQVLAVRQRVLGPGHPDTVQSQNNLASAIVMAAGLAKPSTQPHRRSDKNNVPHGRRPTKSAGAHQRTPHADLEGLTEWSCH
jgi:Tetratricopeptide repeat